MDKGKENLLEKILRERNEPTKDKKKKKKKPIKNDGKKCCEGPD